MMFNIYDYFKSEELVNDLKKLNWQFSELEMIKLIYESKKPIEFKIKGLEYIAENTDDESVSELARKIINMYNDMFDVMEETNNNTYYRVYATDLEDNTVYRTLAEAISLLEEIASETFFARETFSITRYEYDEEAKEIIDLTFIYNLDSEIIDIVHKNENYLDYDLYELDDIYINLPVVLEDCGLQMVAIYNPNPEECEEYYLLSDNQKERKAELEEILSKHEYVTKSKFNGPVYVSKSIDRNDNIVPMYGCINNFVNMYFINEEEHRNYMRLTSLLIYRKMIQEENK